MKINYRILGLLIAAICAFLAIATGWGLFAMWTEMDPSISCLAGLLIGMVAYTVINNICQSVRDEHASWFNRGW